MSVSFVFRPIERWTGATGSPVRSRFKVTPGRTQDDLRFERAIFECHVASLEHTIVDLRMLLGEIDEIARERGMGDMDLCGRCSMIQNYLHRHQGLWKEKKEKQDFNAEDAEITQRCGEEEEGEEGRGKREEKKDGKSMAPGKEKRFR